MIAALARPPVARIVRGPRAWIAVTAWSALVVVFAVIARHRGAVHGADHVLVDTYGALVVPLLAYVLVGAALASQSLRASTAALVSIGATPVRAAAAAIGVAALSCMAIAAAVAAVVAVVAHGVGDPPYARDAIASAYAGALGSAAYVSWFSLGATFGRRGGGRTVFLIVDWILGAAGGAGALATPRGHLRNLLGGPPPMDVSERASAFILVGFTLLYASLALRRSRV